MKKHLRVSVFVVCIFVFAFAIMGAGLALLFPVKYKDEIVAHATTYNLEPSFVASVINAESGFDKNSVSPAGAIGLMQLMPSTAIEIAEKLNINNFKISDLHDPDLNILFGCYYLRYLYNKFGGVEENVLAAYNAGFTNVEAWLLSTEFSSDGYKISTTPFSETNNYIKRVKINNSIYKKIF